MTFAVLLGLNIKSQNESGATVQDVNNSINMAYDTKKVSGQGVPSKNLRDVSAVFSQNKTSSDSSSN